MDIVQEKYEEWTSGLPPEQARINVFEKIRDIAYYIDLRLLSLKKGPAGMLSAGRGSCTPKHFLLGMMLEKLGLPVKYISYPFHWKDMGLECPRAVRETALRIPVTYHHANSVFIEDKWVLLDATWDPQMEKAGFPVNARWDGKSDTALAVAAGRPVEFSDIQQQDKAIKAEFRSYSLTDKLELSRFTLEFNRWIGKLREGSS